MPAVPGHAQAVRAAFVKASKAQDREDVALFDQFFSRTTNGTFVEIGALDGISLSNTLAFETVLNWSGLLIEANPALCARLWRSARPRSIKRCSGISDRVALETFEEGRYTSTFHAVSPETERFGHGRRRRHLVKVAPFGHLLRSAGVSSVDLISLDVEGSEARVLQSMDWNISVRVWCIEYQPAFTPPAVNASIARILNEHNYVCVPWSHSHCGQRCLAHNQLWVKRPNDSPADLRHQF